MTHRRRDPTTSTRRRRSPHSTLTGAVAIIAVFTLLHSFLLLPICHARRGALVRDGMNSKSAWDNPLLGRQAGDITMDPDVVAITTRCSKWALDPIAISPSPCGDSGVSGATAAAATQKIVNDVLSNEVRTLPLHVTFRSKTLAGGKRPNWMRASATLGEKDPSVFILSKKTVPLRAVWTCSNADADTSSISYEELQNPKLKKKQVGMNVLEDSYEDCLKRLYGKYVELEVLLPKTKRMMNSSSSVGGGGGGGPPPSLVYRVPIQTGHVNPMGMVPKSRATVTLYPYGRTLATASSTATAATPTPSSSSREGGGGDLAIPLGMTNVHLPLGPGLVDPSWAKGRKLFWKGQSVGLV